MEARTVNVGIKEVAEEHLKDRSGDLLEQRFLPNGIGKELPAPLRLHYPQDKDPGRRSAERLVRNAGELDQLKLKVRHERREIPFSPGWKIEQGGKNIRDPPGRFILGKHHGNNHGKRFARLLFDP